MRSTTLALLGLCAAALAPAPAAAYFVRSTTDMGTPVFWRGGCAFITPDTIPPPEMPLAEVLATLERSVSTWQKATVMKECSYFQLAIDEPRPNETLLDGTNVMKFRMGRWCHPDDPAAKQKEECHSSLAIAITTVYYNSDEKDVARYASVLDADIELNTINYTFVNYPSTVTARENTTLADLENTLTHELGHFMGLDHTCWDPKQNPIQPKDETGARVPHCGDVKAHLVSDDLYDKITTSTMYPEAPSSDVSKRSLAPIDIEAICRIYPSAKDPMACFRLREEGCGCTVGARRSTGGALALLGLAVVIVILGRRGWRRR